MRKLTNRVNYSLTLEDKTEIIKQIFVLSGIDETSHALAFVFQDHSYAIVGFPSGKLMEYCLSEDSFPYSEKAENYYIGPFNYYSKTALGYQDLLTKEVIPFHLAEERFIDRQTQSMKTEMVRDEASNNRLYDEWIGLPESRFYPYRNWHTPSGYLCGTYASTVLLAYYQDYIDETIIPKELREKGENRYEDVASYLRRLIQPHGLPTIPFQVGFGLSRYFDHFGLNYRARTTVIGSWARATKRMQQGKPIELGILKILGSSYGNHWVTAYAYLEKSDGSRYYKIHDNWGNYNKVINASWGNGTVSLR
ncbi:hypothetical protein IGI37_002637 [Enterococcus sp. AZ194]|uniref:dihydrolipoamide dehydrogenase n=1 Tax=Enterococcus sp. AZ194 TaxID=2774629 RepID=UPI003F2924ED